MLEAFILSVCILILFPVMAIVTVFGVIGMAAVIQLLVWMFNR